MSLEDTDDFLYTGSHEESCGNQGESLGVGSITRISIALLADLPVREAPMLSELFCNYMI